MFGQIGARGVSVIVSAGNFGPGMSCQSNDGTNTTKFLPGFPATCPYVTSVGGTQYNNPEEVWDISIYPPYVLSSGGGFSEVWSRPNWQKDAVKKYLDKIGNDWKPYYNKNGRAVPDVSALAYGHQVMNNGTQKMSGGTR